MAKKYQKMVFFDFSGWRNFLHLVYSDLTAFKGLRLLKCTNVILGRNNTLEGIYGCNTFLIFVKYQERYCVPTDPLETRWFRIRVAVNQSNRYERYSSGSGHGLFQFIQLFVTLNRPYLRIFH